MEKEGVAPSLTWQCDCNGPASYITHSVDTNICDWCKKSRVPYNITSEDLKTGNIECFALYEVEYHKDVPTMSWWIGRKGGEWKNFTWELGFVGSVCLQKDSITFLVSDCIGCSRMLTVQRKDVKSMRLIDRNVPPQWWDLAEYGARSGEWSEEPMGVDERHIVIE